MIASNLDSLKQDWSKALEEYAHAMTRDQEYNVAKSENVLRAFISRCDNTHQLAAPSKHYKLVAHSYLGDRAGTLSAFQEALTSIFGGRNETHRHLLDAGPGQSLPASLVRQQWYGLAEVSIGQCFLARDWSTGGTVLAQIEKLIPGYFNLDPVRQTHWGWQQVAWIGAIREHNGQYRTALEWYLQAREIVETLRSTNADPDARRAIFANVHTSEIFSGLARVAVHFASSDAEATTPVSWRLPGPSWKDQALLFLEQGKARSVLDGLMADETFDRVTLDTWSTNLYEYRRMAEDTGFAKQRESKTAEMATSLRLGDGDETSMLEQSLHLRGLLPLTFFAIDTAALYKSIPTGTAVLYTSLSRSGLLVLCVTADGVQQANLSPMTDIEARRLVLQVLRFFQECRDELQPIEEISGCIESLSQAILRPLIPILLKYSAVVFVPLHALHRLPFAILNSGEEPLFLSHDIAQVPSLHIMQRLSQKPPRQATSTCIIVKPGDPEPEKEDEALLALPCAEAAAIAKDMDGKIYYGAEIASAQFLKLLEEHDVVHVATHGAFTDEDTSAWRSNICLRDRLEVLEFTKLHSQASLVVFSACLTGLGVETVGNDVIGFSHVILSSGVNAFVGGLWELDDLAAAVMMALFYKFVARLRPTEPLTACFTKAIRQLYHMKQAESIAEVNQLVSGFKQAVKEKAMPLPETEIKAIAKQLKYLKEDIKKGRRTSLFRHPYYWAPFIMVGNGARKLNTPDHPTRGQDSPAAT